MTSSNERNPMTTKAELFLLFEMKFEILKGRKAFSAIERLYEAYKHFLQVGHADKAISEGLL